MEHIKYDVFISCKSEDYDFGRKLYVFLSQNGITSFLADEELRKLGVSDYGKAIDDALENSTHLIVVTSSSSFTRQESSPYVYYEWHTFMEEKKSGRKQGNIMTIVSEKEIISQLPIALRNNQAFAYNEIHNIIGYLKRTSVKSKPVPENSETSDIVEISEVNHSNNQLSQLRNSAHKKIEFIREIGYSFCIILFFILLEALLYSLNFDVSVRSNAWHQRLLNSSNGLVNLYSTFIPSQLFLVSAILFYFSSGIKSTRKWFIHFLKTYICYLLFFVSIRILSWISYYFLCEILVSVFASFLYYTIWSLLMKRFSRTAKFIPF